MQNQNVIINLKVSEVETILKSLAALPFNQVADLILGVRDQAQRQLTALQQEQQQVKATSAAPAPMSATDADSAVGKATLPGEEPLAPKDVKPVLQ